jgi:hypothetical protein
MPRLRIVERCLHFAIRLHGLVRVKLSDGFTCAQTMSIIMHNVASVGVVRPVSGRRNGAAYIATCLWVEQALAIQRRVWDTLRWRDSSAHARHMPRSIAGVDVRTKEMDLE